MRPGGGIRRLLVCAAAAFAVALATVAPSGVSAEEPAARAALRKTVLEALRKPPTRAEAVSAVESCADDRSALLAALEGAAAMDEHVARAIEARDAQSRTLFQYYRDRILGQNEPEKERKAYHEMCNESRALCGAIRDALGVQAKLQEIARARCVRLSAAEESAAAEVAPLISATKVPGARAALFGGLAGRTRTDLAGELLKAAASETSRAERLAALQALEGGLPHDCVPAVRLLFVTEDSYVRRAAYAVLAAERSTDAMDGLIGRVALERSVARDELVDRLGRITGQVFGDAPKAWQDWWATARATWDGKSAEAAPRTPPPGKTRYFGLDVRSSRVVFVLDCSTSMTRGMRCPGPGLRGEFGEPKLEVAMRELEQALRTLPDAASVNAVAFGTSVRTFSKRLVPATAANREKLLQWVKKVELEDSTNLGGALVTAFESLAWTPNARDEEIADTVCVLSDGDPNSGPLIDPTWIEAEVRRLNPGGLTRVHTVCLGIESRPDLMYRLARANGGLSTNPAK